MSVNGATRPSTAGSIPSSDASVGPMTSAAWREEALARAHQMTTLLEWLERESELQNKDPLVKAVKIHLDAAKEGAQERHHWVVRTLSGAIIERTSANLDAAELNLMRLAPLDYLQSNVPNLLVHARGYLKPSDPRLRLLEALAKDATRRKLEHPERNAIVAAIQGAAEEGRRAQNRVRSFRNVIVFTAVLIMALGVVIGLVGLARPDALPLCFQPEERLVVCPTDQARVAAAPAGGQQDPGAVDPAAVEAAIEQAAHPWDAALIEFIGLLGASVAATVALRRSRGTTDPYSLPGAIALLKVVTGALTAFLGLLLIRAQFIPGLSALDSSAQIVAWAVVLGYAQQLFTRAVDQQAQNVLSEAQEPAAPTGRSPEELQVAVQTTAPLSQPGAEPRRRLGGLLRGRRAPAPEQA
jgi:hypothetical protein